MFKCHHSRCAKKKWKDFRLHYEPDAYKPKPAGEREYPAEKPEKESPADIVTRLAQADCELWHAPDKSAYATYMGGTSFPIASESFRQVLNKLYYDHTRKGLSEAATKEAASTLAAIGCYDGKEYEVFKRVARVKDTVFIDLGDDTHDCVQITAQGWAILHESPVRFSRTPNTGKLPRLEAGGSIDLLRPFVNLGEDDFRLFVGSLLDSLKGRPDFFVNVASGAPGSAKSTLCRIAVKLIDPVLAAELSFPPERPKDLANDAKNNYLLAYDNLEKLSNDLSNALCSVSTGGGYKTRQLYTDSDQIVVNIAAPVWFNGIQDFVSKPDLIDRSIIMHSKRIPDEDYQDKDEFFGRLEKVSPQILGALYSAVSRGLSALPDVEVKMKRMGNSVKWLAACLPGLGWDYAKWEEAFRKHQELAVEIAMESSPGGLALLAWLEHNNVTDWEGSNAELYRNLIQHVALDHQRYFPHSPSKLMASLRLYSDALAKKGITLDSIGWKKGSHTHKITFKPQK